MARSTAWIAAYLALVFQRTNAAGVANATGGTDLYLSLHTADPTGGNQNTSETAYTNYARIPVARDNTGFTIVGSTAENAGTDAFPTCGVTGSTVTYVGIGTLASGAGELLEVIQLAAPAVIASGVTPQFNPGDLQVTAS